ncbi:lipopolysaccharide biosynthesis protein [Lactococcus lactis]|uniref:lipopolysaccharide biosynthesis protein n=1 Tax=Lactococcus lactis TaxID=1358 RepID=UPI00165252D9|nr:polysaccharide biosynthesis C-terminal domain-containing protein [Lactococcus lactis]QNL92848.1 polysaccharide biosynthesis C-terminal domain-containing protein [Lactococcus lactis]
MNKIFKSLAGNTLIFALGNGSALLVSFFMIPIYTSILSTAAFGISDLITTTVSMLLPIVSLNIFTAVFRWSLDENNNRSETFSNGLLITIIGAIIFIIIGLLSFLFHTKYIWAITFNISGVVLLNLLQNFYRGINKIRLYALSGVVGAVTNAILNILLMIVFKFGLTGYLLSLVISNYTMVLFLTFFGKAFNYWNKNLISSEKILEMLKFSMPMIPNAFTWWMTNDISRLIILVFVGPSGNGLYAVANKLPSMMFTMFSLFQNAWQISSVKTAQDKDAERIYSITFNAVVALMIYFSTFLISIVKIFMTYYVSPSYFEAWKFIPILLMTSMFSNVSGFLGTTYLVAKQTKGLFTTTVWGMVVNLMMGFILIPLIGVQGAAISGALGFLLVTIIRLRQTAKWVKIRIRWNGHVFLILGYISVSLNEYFYFNSISLNILVLLVMTLCLIRYLRVIRT